KLGGGEEGGGCGGTDCGDAGKFTTCRSNQSMKPATIPQQFVGNANRVDLPAAAAKHERHELVIAQGSRTVSLQLLARTIVGRQLFHRTTVGEEALTVDHQASVPPNCQLSRVDGPNVY